MKKFLILTLFQFLLIYLYAQIPTNYYNDAYGKNGYQLKVALHEIISSHTTLSYNSLWDYFEETDAKSNGKVWDMYSDIPEGTPRYEFTFGSDKCGNYNSEGDCYNREHSVPASWFNDASPMYTDLFHLYPTDGYVNNRRGNLPFGKVNNPSWTSTNGSKMGNCSTPGYNGNAFEPIDAYKGDFARSIFYMATCYMDKNFSHTNSSAFQGGNLKPWAANLLIQWHLQDPVSTKEIERNNNVYHIQHNRNPFIDFPELVEMIFGNDTLTPFNYSSISNYSITNMIQISPNPAQNILNISLPENNNQNTFLGEIININGKIITHFQCNEKNIKINITSLPKGFYIIRFTSSNYIETQKLIIQ